jgi:hypothetical protein
MEKTIPPYPLAAAGEKEINSKTKNLGMERL